MRSETYLATLVLALGCRHAAEEEAEPAARPAQVTCSAATTTDIAELVELHGVIAPEPRLDAIISSPVAGRVTRVLVEEGDTVAAGASLALVEDPALPADSVSARASVASARAAKEAADQELARQQRLVTSGIGARRDLEEARAKAQAAQAELDAATARSGLASQRLARSELRAPHAGVILHVWKRAGESVDGTSATPILEVADVGNLEVRAQVPAGILGRLRDGMPAQLHTLASDAPVAGTVRRVAPAVDPATLMGTVRIRFSHSTGLTVGTAATAAVEVGRHAGLQVPATALRRSSVGTDEVVVCKDGKAEVRAVTLGTRSAPGGAAPDRVEIVQGVTTGEQLVTDHVLGLEDGQELVAPAGTAK